MTANVSDATDRTSMPSAALVPATTIATQKTTGLLWRFLGRANLIVVWAAAFGAAIAISWHFSGASTQFFGIADDQEQTVRFKTPVEVVSFGFMSGQEIASGDLIVAVREPQLEANLQQVGERHKALRLAKGESSASMRSEIVRMEADLQATLTGVDSQIRMLRARETATAAMLKDLSRPAAGTSPVEREIDGLVVRRRALQRATQAKVDDLRARLSNAEHPIDAEIKEREKELEALEHQRTQLRVHANFDGRIGSVNFRVGETVAPFQPVLTVHGTRPSFVRGYIHETVLNDVRLGDTVWIRSVNAADGANWHRGAIESLGTRIVEFPTRLKVNVLTQAWGREVVVRLGLGHSLLLGEKVVVHAERPRSLYERARALLADLLP